MSDDTPLLSLLPRGPLAHIQAQAHAVYIDPEVGIGILPDRQQQQHDVIAPRVCLRALCWQRVMSRPTTAEGR